LYLLTVVVTTPSLVVIVVSQPHYSIASALEYAPVLIASTLLIIEDCCRSHPGASHQGASHHLPWLVESFQDEDCASSTSSRAMGRNSSLGVGRATSVVSEPNDENSSILSAQESLLLRYIWSPSQSSVPSSRLSDISLPSSGLRSLPSSWGTPTRAWFPEFFQPEDNPL
jgi:hypothetical protein